MGSANTQATRSTLQSVDTTLSENINATQNYIPVASTTNFSTSVVAEIESTNEVVSFNDISKNDFQRSEEFDNAYWTKHNSSISANAITAPDGTLTADELIEDSTSSVMHNVQRSFVVFASNPNGIGFSCFAKSKTRTKFYLAYGATNNMQSRAEFNLATGAATTTNPFGFTASASMEDFGNGWFRCKFFFTTGGSAYNPNVYIGLADASGNTVYNGDGSSSLYIWGAQQELNDSVISTYLPTTSSALVGLTGVTRGVNETTAQAASSGDSIQQLPFAFQQVLATVTSTLSEDIDATQNYVPVASTSGFVKGVDATIESTNEVVSFATITENLFSYSQNFANGYWSKNNSLVNATGAVAPDGTSTAEGLRENSSTTSHNIIRNSLTTVSGQKYVISVFAKWTGQRYLQIGTGAGNVATNPHQNFDIETGVLGTSNGTITGAITDAGNGWYRCSVVVTSQVTTGFIPVYSLAQTTNSNRAPSYTGQGTGAGDMLLLWGAQFEESDSITGYLPTTTSSLQGLTTVTRGVNATTAQAASSGASVSQTPSLASLDMPVRLRAISVSPDGTGNARLTLCDNNGDTLCDVDIPNAKSYTFNMPEEGIIFPNGVFISNTDNITAYTVYTEKYSGPGLTS